MEDGEREAGARRERLGICGRWLSKMCCACILLMAVTPSFFKHLILLRSLYVSLYLQWVHKLVFLEKPVLELCRLAARPCVILVCANGRRCLTSADSVTLGGWWDTLRED